MEFSRPRGTRDFLPEEAEERKQVEEIMRASFEKFGYREVQTPIFENLELITAKSGEEIREHLFHFKDRSKRDLALRPEFTAPVIRLYVNQLQSRPKPLKLYYVGNCFRYERPQSGRYREFWQAGVELIGSDYPEADAEVIALAVKTLENLGLSEFETQIGHIGVLRKILEAGGVIGEDQNAVMSAIDKKERKRLEKLLDDLMLDERAKSLLFKVLRLKGDRKDAITKATKLLKENPYALKELEKLEKTLEMLKYFAIDYKLNLGIARGLDYYTGVVFEIYEKKLRAQKQICGGGSYSLTDVFGGEAVPMCGFAFGFDRVMLAIKAENIKIKTKKGTDILIIPTGEKMLPKAIEISNVLRKKFSCEIDLLRRRLRKALAFADGLKIPYVIIVGEEEMKKGKVILRNMNTGEQKEVAFSALGGLSLEGN